MRKLTFKRIANPAISDEQKQQLRSDLEKMLPNSDDIEAVARSQIQKAQDDILWVSDEFQVNIDSSNGHLSIRMHDNTPITNRDDMLAIAAHFIKAKRMVPVELYPKDSKVIDTSNNFHVWALSMKRHAVENAVNVALESPGEVVELGDGYQAVMLAVGSERSWRQTQQEKNTVFGLDREAFDLLLPITHSMGVLLLALPEGVINPIGWQKGIRSVVETPDLDA
ncbi:MAG: DUF7694 domain-containing protein [Oceanococcus sp.]